MLWVFALHSELSKKILGAVTKLGEQSWSITSENRFFVWVKDSADQWKISNTTADCKIRLHDLNYSSFALYKLPENATQISRLG